LGAKSCIDLNIVQIQINNVRSNTANELENLLEENYEVFNGLG